MLFDIAFSPLAAAKTNERLIKKLDSGESVDLLPDRPSRRWIVETGMNNIVRAGYGYRLLGGYVSAEAFAGLSVLGLNPFRPGASVAFQAKVFPFRSVISRFYPFIVAGVSAETNFSEIAASVFGGIGYEIPLRWLDLSFGAGLAHRFHAGRTNMINTIGVKL